MSDIFFAYNFIGESDSKTIYKLLMNSNKYKKNIPKCQLKNLRAHTYFL